MGEVRSHVRNRPMPQAHQMLHGGPRTTANVKLDAGRPRGAGLDRTRFTPS